MKRSLFIVAILISSLFYSCSKEESPDDFVYQGTWSGTYSGDADHGSWTAIVDAEGDVTGGATSSVYSATYPLVGSITSEGVFNATAGSASTGTEFIGQFDGSTASGTWSNSTMDISGTWSGSKE